jgi:arylsulfatase A-like enzyme
MTILQYLREYIKSAVSRRVPFLAAAALLAAVPARAAAHGLVIIGWDTLRADHIGTLGYKRNTTPDMDEFASQSVLFTRAISAASWTLPSFMSVFTGLYPSEHGVTNKFMLPPEGSTELKLATLSTGTVTLAEFLKANGYRTAAFTGGAGVGGSFGFSRGFDIYSDSVNFAGFGSTFPKALDWIKKNKDADYFVFVHGYDTHPFHDLVPGIPYTFITRDEAAGVPKLRARHEKLRLAEIDGRLPKHTAADVKLWTDVYDEKIFRTDKLLGEFLAGLKALGGGEPVTILFADHGEELFDHGGIDHGMTLYQEMIHVPLIVRAPGMKPGRVDSQVRTLDIFPTVLDLLGLKPGEALKRQLRGASLVPLMTGGAKGNRDAYSETDYLFHFEKRSLREPDGMKFLQDELQQKNELYDTASDPAEKKDLSEKDPAKAYILENQLFDWEDGLKPYR